jgi:hypothetical protein
MKPGDRYNWKNQPENLIYLGMCEPRNGQWHQFAKVEKPDEVWCEVHPQDLHMLEVTAGASLEELDILWDALGDIPTVFEGDDVDRLELSFLHFPAGTHREEVWHWFEAQNPKFSVAGSQNRKAAPVPIIVTDGKGLSPSALIAMGIASSSHFQPARKVRRPKLNQPPAEAQRLIEAAEAKRARRVAKAIKWGAV